MNTRIALAAGVLIATAIGTASCGGSSSGSGSTGAVASASVAVNPASPTAATSPTAAASATGGTSTSQTRAVTIQNFAFAPKALTVPVGTRVTWTNKDTATHTVTATNHAFDSNDLQTGKSFSYTFTKAGTYSYLCEIHPYMTAQVIVQ